MPTNLRETIAARVRELECTRASLATDPVCYQVGWEDMGFAVLNLIAESPELAAVDWRLANDPPIGEPHKWTRDVVAVTNAGRACAVAYMHGDNGRPGVWQRLASFERGEGVVCWRPMPGEVLEGSQSDELTALRAEVERLRELLLLASETIDGLSDQQAMTDLWYVEPWERIKAALAAKPNTGEGGE